MSAWTFLFILIGVIFLTAQFFRLIDLIEQPPRASRRSWWETAEPFACRPRRRTVQR